MLDRDLAETYAGWFSALADPTRIQVLNLLAEHGAPMTVREIVEQAPVGQSTVSAHLKVLADSRFVLAESRGTSRLYRVNEACLSCFPSAADVVMGRTPTPFDAVATTQGGARKQEGIGGVTAPSAAVTGERP